MVKRLRNNKILMTSLEAFFITLGLARVFYLNTGNILTVVIFIMSWVFISFTRDRSSVKELSEDPGDVLCRFKRINICAHILGALFAFMYMLFKWEDMVSDLNNVMFRIVILLASFLGLMTLFYFVSRFVLYYLSDKEKTNSVLIESAPDERKWTKHLGLFTFLLCFILYLPYFLYQFPGIMTPDSINQFEQAMGMVSLSNHHPWIHTLIIKLFYNIGGIFSDDVSVRAAFYTVFQMCFMCFCASFLVSTLKKFRFKTSVCIITAVFFAAVPYNAVHAITVWKDVPFAGIVLLFVCAMLRIKKDIEDETKGAPYIFDIALFIVMGFALSTFRSNGFYAFIVLIPFLMVYFFKKSKAMIIAVLAILITTVIFKGPVMKAYNVESPDFVESVAIPIQQIAYVYVSDEDVDPEITEEIEKVVDLTYIHELYCPNVADNLKELVRAGDTEYLENHKGEFLKIYIKLGLNYPLDYIKAYAYQTNGFYFPDRLGGEADTEGVIASKTGITSTPLIGGKLVIKLKEVLLKLADIIPVYGVLWSMGASFWILLMFMAVCFVRGYFDSLIYFLPYLLIQLTLLVATPLGNEFRYDYFLLYGLPLIVLIPFIHDNDRPVL